MCLFTQLYCALCLADKFTYRIVGVQGPSMMPVLEARDDLVLIDCFTHRFVRTPRKGEVVMAKNPYKPGHTVIKRVINTEGEIAKFWS